MTLPREDLRGCSRPRRIASLSRVKRYIDAISFRDLKQKICSPPSKGGLRWSRSKANYVERQYKNFLFLVRKHDGERLVPSEDIDMFWHLHILDTQSYVRHCGRILGRYIHHQPYGPAKKLSVINPLFERTLERYEQEFGEPIYEFEEAAR